MTNLTNNQPHLRYFTPEQTATRELERAVYMACWNQEVTKDERYISRHWYGELSFSNLLYLSTARELHKLLKELQSRVANSSLPHSYHKTHNHLIRTVRAHLDDSIYVLEA